jgi:hypothetical protein
MHVLFHKKGYIAVADPEDGCGKMARPPPNISYVDPSKWIALIKRSPSRFGNCSFDVKVLNAQNAGFSAVIIYNSESDNLIKMSSNGMIPIQIPSVFVGHSTGLEISKYFTYMNKTYALINNDDSDLNYLLIPFVSVVTICFLVAVCIFVIKLALHCHRVRKNRVPRSALRKIPTKKYQKTDKYDTCPICLNEYEEGVKIRLLLCEHVYHIECIDKWLLRNNRFCPVCKRRVLPGGESDSENENENSTTATDTRPLVRDVDEHRANEDEQTDERSHLLVSEQRRHSNNGAEDADSVLTNSATFGAACHRHNNSSVTNLTSNSTVLNNDITSLNNHMTNSVASSTQMNAIGAGASGGMASSSKYGSISSINKRSEQHENEAFINDALTQRYFILTMHLFLYKFLLM